MGRQKAKKPRRQRPLPGHGPGEKIIWNKSPARALLAYPENIEMQETVALWDYTLVNPSGSRILMNLGGLADESGQSLLDTARALVELEDAGFSTWNPEANELRMSLGPDDMRSTFSANGPGWDTFGRDSAR